MVIVSNKTSKKSSNSYDRLTAYGHNQAWNSTPIDAYISKDGDINDAYVFHITALDPTPDSPNVTVTANNAVVTAYNNATIGGFIHFGNYKPTEWGIDVTTNSSIWDNTNVSLTKSNTISSWNGSGTNISVNFGTDVAAENNPLKADTKYYYRFWVKYGNDQFEHSEIKEFTTPKNEPHFSTPTVTKGNGANNIKLASTITWPTTAIPVEWGVDIATEYIDTSFQNVDFNFSREITASLRSQYANGLPVSLDFASETAQANMLQPGTQYWYRFWVRYQAGNDDRFFAHSEGETSFITAGNADTAVTYKINYNANGGMGAPENQTKTHGIILTLSDTKPTRADSSAGKYTVTLNANGGSVSPTSLDAARTTSYTFKNWNTKSDGSGTSYNAGANYTANEAATLYAQWDSSTSTAQVTLPTPTRQGYTFKGWSTSSTANSGSTGEYTPTGNVTLYAVWEINSYYLDLNGNVDGMYCTNITDYGYADIYIDGELAKANASDYFALLKTGTSYEIKNIRAMDGYRFIGNNTYSGIIANEAVGVTLPFASIKTIKYNGNNGTGAPEDQIKVYGQTLTLSTAVPTRAGYIFLGWAESADATAATYKPGDDFVKDADTTLYAVWQKKAPDFVLPAALTTIGEEAFAGGAFSYAHLPDGVTRIEKRAFADCPNLHDVDIPESATSIDPTAFAGVTGLTIHGVDGSYAESYASQYGFAFIPAA